MEPLPVTAPLPAIPPGRRSLPGDLDFAELRARMIRVNHAGEFGAKRIYEGQLAVIPGHTQAAAEIRHMAEQERHHLAVFEQLMADRHVRPTLLYPVWNVAAFALGAATALLGIKAAMACTIAVEEVIEQHYAAQAEALGEDDPELRGHIEVFRAEEIEHRDHAAASGGREAVGYPVLSAAIKASSRLAIWISERI